MRKYKKTTQVSTRGAEMRMSRTGTYAWVHWGRQPVVKSWNAGGAPEIPEENTMPENCLRRKS